MSEEEQMIELLKKKALINSVIDTLSQLTEEERLKIFSLFIK